MNLTCIGFGVVIIIAGILFACQKLLPAAWKKMKDDEKAKIKIKPLCINVGVMISLCGVILLTRGLWLAFEGKPFLFAMISWLVVSAIDVAVISKSKYYRNE